jgi:hypothetical protein
MILAADLAHRHETKFIEGTFQTRAATRSATQAHAAGLRFTMPIGVERAQYAHSNGRLEEVAYWLFVKRPDYHGIHLISQNLSLVLDRKS